MGCTFCRTQRFQVRVEHAYWNWNVIELRRRRRRRKLGELFERGSCRNTMIR
jgi:hypothetical protein